VRWYAQSDGQREVEAVSRRWTASGRGDHVLDEDLSRGGENGR